MKVLEVNGQKFELNVGEQLTVKELRVIYPIIKKYQDNEIEMVVQFFKAFSSDAEVEAKLDEMSIEDFTVLSNGIAELIQEKKKQ